MKAEGKFLGWDKEEEGGVVVGEKKRLIAGETTRDRRRSNPKVHFGVDATEELFVFFDVKGAKGSAHRPIRPRRGKNTGK